MKKLFITICETAKGWTVTNGDDSNPFDTAAEAQKAAKQIGDELAENGTSNIIIITWQPSTNIGRQVVRAIT